MSVPAIRKALETALAAITPALPTAWEGVNFTPTAGVAYQQATTLFAQPENDEMSARYRQGGFMQVSLFYPTGTGPALIEARAKLIRDAFWRGRTVTADGVNTTIEYTPEISSAPIDGENIVRVVRIRFFSNDLT